MPLPAAQRAGAPTASCAPGGGVLTRLLHVDGEPVVVHGWQRRDGAVAIRAVPAGEVCSSRGARARGRADALRARRRRRPAPVLRGVQARPVHRPGDPAAALAAAEAPAVRVGGAGLGDHRAADRVVARRRDPAADGAPLGPRVGLARQGDRAPAAARRARARGRRRPGPGRARGLRPRPRARDRDGQVRPRGRERPRRPRRPRRRRPLRPDQRDRPVDAPMPRPLRPRRARLAAGRRPGLREAGRRRRRTWAAARPSRRSRSSTRRTSRTAGSPAPSR